MHDGFAARVAVLGGSVVALLLAMPTAVEQRAEYLHAAWSGRYCSSGRFAGVCLELAPGAGVTATFNVHRGSTRSSEGTAESGADGHLHLRYAQPPGTKLPFPVELVPVRWGPRRYLMHPDRLHDFVTAVKLGEEPRDHRRGEFMLCEGDEERDVEGLPELPPAYARLLSSSDVKQRAPARELSASRPEFRAPVAHKTNAQPRYPRAALREGVEATVNIRLSLNARGRVQDVKIISGPPEFALAVREVATKWRFEPATSGGKPIAWSVLRSVKFALEPEPVTVPGERGG